jgi:deoxyribonuclease V
MNLVAPHPWEVSTSEAKEIQLRLRHKLSTKPELGIVSTVAGVDVGVKNKVTRAAVVVLSYPELEPIDRSVAEMQVTMPYVPGLLSFREGAVVLSACEELDTEPDLFIFDGHGYAHPRRFGIASHMGVILDKPSIGCAKSRLCGTHGEPAPEAGAHVPLCDGDEVIGAVVRTRDRVSPVYVSIGHRLDLETAIGYVLGCCKGDRLPETTRHAHRLASAGKPS